MAGDVAWPSLSRVPWALMCDGDGLTLLVRDRAHGRLPSSPGYCFSGRGNCRWGQLRCEARSRMGRHWYFDMRRGGKRDRPRGIRHASSLQSDGRQNRFRALDSHCLYRCGHERPHTFYRAVISLAHFSGDDYICVGWCRDGDVASRGSKISERGPSWVCPAGGRGCFSGSELRITGPQALSR